MKPRQTFRQWLRVQAQERADPVGDLARDFFIDTCGKRLRTVRSIRNHILFRHFPDYWVREVLDEAVCEYLQDQLEMRHEFSELETDQPTRWH